MYKLVKILLFCCLCFNATVSNAQYDEYIKSENNRVNAAQQTEIEIQNFIRDNFNKYKLSQEINDKIIHHLRSEDEFSDTELEQAKVDAKKYELRKLYFVQNPEKKEDYLAKVLPTALQIGRAHV